MRKAATFTAKPVFEQKHGTKPKTSTKHNENNGTTPLRIRSLSCRAVPPQRTDEGRKLTSVTLYCHTTSSNNDSTHYTVHYAIVRHQGGRCRSSWLQYAPHDKHCNLRNSLSCLMKIRVKITYSTFVLMWWCNPPRFTVTCNNQIQTIYTAATSQLSRSPSFSVQQAPRPFPSLLYRRPAL